MVSLDNMTDMIAKTTLSPEEYTARQQEIQRLRDEEKKTFSSKNAKKKRKNNNSGRLYGNGSGRPDDPVIRIYDSSDDEDYDDDDEEEEFSVEESSEEDEEEQEPILIGIPGFDEQYKTEDELRQWTLQKLKDAFRERHGSRYDRGDIRIEVVGNKRRKQTWIDAIKEYNEYT